MAPNGTTVKSESASRYGNAAPKDLEGVEDLKPEDVPVLVGELRKVFESERTYSLEWRKKHLRQFGKMLVECEEELCAAMKKDLNKSHFEGFVTELSLVQAEVQTALSHLDEWVKPEKKSNTMLNIPCWSTTQRDPLGVVLVLGAWNYPMQLSMAPIVAAIAAGNTVVMKPGSYAVASSNALARVFKRYMSPEVVRVIEGNREITNALLEQKFDKIFFTGSGFVGKIVARAAAEHLTPCVLELGGKSPCIIDRSADIEHAVQRLVWGAFMNSGQTCVRPDFVMVHEAIADKFFKKVQSTIIEFYGEDAQKTEWFGRVINDSAFKRLSALVDHEKDRLVFGGNTDASERYIQPSVFDFKNDFKAFSESPIMQDELFGPLMPCVRYSNIDQVVKFVKELPTGKPLALYCFGSDKTFIQNIKTRTTSGGLCVNDCVMHLSNHSLPFGGVGNSGMGNYHGKYGFDALTHEKAVLEKSQLLDQSILFKPLLQARFPPYTPFKQTIVRLFGAHWTDALANLPMPALRLFVKLFLAYFIFSRLGFRIVRE